MSIIDSLMDISCNLMSVANDLAENGEIEEALKANKIAQDTMELAQKLHQEEMVNG